MDSRKLVLPEPAGAASVESTADAGRQAEALNREGCLAWLNGEYDLAAQRFMEAAQADPTLLASYLNLAAVERIRSGAASAHDRLASLANQGDDKGTIRHQLGWVRLVEGLHESDEEETERGLLDLAAAAPGGNELIFPVVNSEVAGWLARRGGKLEPPAGLTALGEPGRFILAELHRLKGEWPEAVRQYELLLSSKPNDGFLQARIAAVKFALDDHVGAEDAFAQAASNLSGPAAAQAMLYAQVAQMRLTGNTKVASAVEGGGWLDWQHSILTGSVGRWRIAWRHGDPTAPRQLPEWTDSWFLRGQHEQVLTGDDTLNRRVAAAGAPWLLSFTMAKGRL